MILKYFLGVAISGVLILILYLNYDAHFSIEAKKGKSNFQNADKVKIGMNKNEVIEIMGSPIDSFVGHSVIEGNIINYKYSIPPGSSGFCDITFDSTLKVSNVHNSHE